MLPQTVSENKQRIDNQVALMDTAASTVDFRMQAVFSAYLITLASGHIEIGVREILRRYGALRSNSAISSFIGKTVDRENSLNCEKIKRLLDKFDTAWHLGFANVVREEETEAVNSLKTLRDSIAHGRPNGTGYLTVKGYYINACHYVEKLAATLA